MPPHPKRKHSSGRRDRRRAHDALLPPNLVGCANCGVQIPAYTVCPQCGYYDGRKVLEPKKKKAEKKQ
ncbi:MAG: 50S ribosomal protein L32 [Anaerolineales bacterium]